MHTAPITEIQRFCTHDGPGIRTTVFFKGCPLRCAWCHNPETQSPYWQILFHEAGCIFCGACVSVCPENAHRISDRHVFDRNRCTGCGSCTEICPTEALRPSALEMTVAQIAEILRRDRDFYGTDGGVTLSGGEPFFHRKFALDLLRACRADGIGTAVETCGFFPESLIPEAVENTDLFLWDIKDTDPKRHRKYTQRDNRIILSNLRKTDEAGGKTLLRCILVRGVNTEEQHYRALADLYGELKHCAGIDLIPYHAYAGSKNVLLGQEDGGKPDWIPTEDELCRAEELLRNAGVPVRIQGKNA